MNRVAVKMCPIREIASAIIASGALAKTAAMAEANVLTPVCWNQVCAWWDSRDEACAINSSCARIAAIIEVLESLKEESPDA